MNICAIISLGTNKGVWEETKLLKRTGMTILRVVIIGKKGSRESGYVVNDLCEALAVAHDYNQSIVHLLRDNTLTTVDVITGRIIKKGELEGSDEEPENTDWIESDGHYYTVKELK